MTAAVPDTQGGSPVSGGRNHKECPACGGARLFRSRRRGFRDHFASAVWGSRPYRCRDCSLRFYAPPPKMPGRTGLAALGVLALLAAGVAGWYLWASGGRAPADRSAPAVTLPLPGKTEAEPKGRADGLDPETRRLLEALRNAGDREGPQKP